MYSPPIQLIHGGQGLSKGCGVVGSVKVHDLYMAHLGWDSGHGKDGTKRKAKEKTKQNT